MNVDFNNLRAQAAYTLDNLTRRLNAGILTNTDGSRKYEISDQKFMDTQSWVKGNILIDSDDIQKHMEELRSLIMTINAVHEPNDPEFVNNSELIKKNGGVARFNDIEEDKG